MQVKIAAPALGRTLPLLALLVALVLGGALRLNGLNWDQGAKYHPDERFIASTSIELKWPSSVAQFLDRRQSPLNPYYDAQNRRERAFAYGTLPVYVTKAVAGALSLATGKNWETYDDITLVGRALSGLADTAAILIVYLLAARLFGRWTGALASVLYAVTVLSIQHSHFYTTDITLNFFIILALYFALRLSETPSTMWALATGLAIGMALACKTSAAPIVLVAPLALVMHAVRNRGSGSFVSAATRQGFPLILTGVGAVVGLFIFAPYTLLDTQGMLRNFNEQNAILISGEADRPFTRQYYNTTPYFYHIEQMARWSLGWPLAFAAYAGVMAFAWLALRNREKMPGIVLMLGWMLPYFAITGGSHAKFLRYMLPILPILAICAAYVLVSLLRAGVGTAPVIRRIVRVGGAVATAFVAGGSLAWALAFNNIYEAPHTANQASEWINANVPKNAVIAMEHWEEGISGLRGFQTPPGSVQIQSYDDDTAGKPRMYAQALQRADYYVQFSNRLYGTVSRIPDRYPVAREFYRALFDGELGYELVYSGVSMPAVAGVTIFEDTFARPGLPRPEPLRNFEGTRNAFNNGFADESFSAYDHPLVLVWKKTNPAATAQIEQKLAPLVLRTPYNAQAARLGNREPVLTPEQAALNAAGGTFAALFDENSLSNTLPVPVWWLLMALLGLALLPMTLVAFCRLPDRGLSFARPLGWLLLGWLIWMPTSLELTAYTRGLILAMLAVLIGIGGIFAWFTRPSWLPWLRANKKLLLIQELAFTLPFLAFVLIRMGNPDLWHPARGGEKPMDFAYLMASIRTSTLPPMDPWFAGGYINYYYYGQYLVSVPIKLLGILPEVAYNLAVPTFFALAFSCAFSLAFNLYTFLVRAEDGAMPTGRGRYVAGLLGGFMLTTFGNIDGGLRLFRRFVAIGGSPLPEQAVANLDLVSMLGRFVSGLGKWVTQGNAALQIGPDWYWASTRIYPGSGSIQEFPFFTFAYADLHAHLMGLPFTLVVLGAALALSRLVRDADTWRAWLKADGVALALLAPLGLGALWAINSWDYPTFAIAIGGAMLLGWWHGNRTSARLGACLAVGLLVAALSYGLYQPFHANFVQGYTGFDPFNERSPLTGYLTVHGIFLYALVAFTVATVAELLGRASNSHGNAFVRYESSISITVRKPGRRPVTRGGERGALTRAFSLFVSKPDRAGHALRLLAALERGAPAIAKAATEQTPSSEAGSAESPVAAATPAAVSKNGDQVTRVVASILVILGLALGLRWLFANYSSVALVSALGALIAGALAIGVNNFGRRFMFAMVTLAMLLSGVVEIWALKGDIGRMNTVFKFYLQVWSLLSIASAVGIVYLATKLRGNGAWVWPGRLWALGMAILLACGVVYAPAAAYAKINDRFDGARPPFTLDGMAFMQTAEQVGEVDLGGRRQQAKFVLADDQAAIDWARKNIAGSPVILEAPNGPPPHPGLYRWGGRFSIFTGLPTLIGWDWHQRQQRLGTQKIEQRVNDALTIFTAPDIARTRALLDGYNIEYVILGGVERLHYPAAEAKLESMTGAGALTRVYQEGNTRIYKVNRP